MIYNTYIYIYIYTYIYIYISRIKKVLIKSSINQWLFIYIWYQSEATDREQFIAIEFL